jgi:hypothetical protein
VGRIEHGPRANLDDGEGAAHDGDPDSRREGDQEPLCVRHHPTLRP